MNPQYQNRMQRTLTMEGCPATMVLMAAVLVAFVVTELFHGADRWIYFSSDHWPNRPWTLVTGSLQAGGMLGLIFGEAWLFWFGGSVERSLGTRTFSLLWAAISAVTGLFLGLAFLLTRSPDTLLLFVVLDAITVVWALLNPGALVMLMGAIPLRAMTLAWLCVLMSFVMYASDGRWISGIFSLAGCGLAWGYIRYRRYLYRVSGTTRIPRRRRHPDENRGLLSFLRGRRNDRRIEKLIRDSDERLIH